MQSATATICWQVVISVRSRQWSSDTVSIFVVPALRSLHECAVTPPARIVGPRRHSRHDSAENGPARGARSDAHLSTAARRTGRITARQFESIDTYDNLSGGLA